MDQIAATYNFNDNAQMKLNEKIKNALDPNGIPTPGKNGVWLQSYSKANGFLAKKKRWLLNLLYDISLGLDVGFDYLSI
jgi:hypothetical protein